MVDRTPLIVPAHSPDWEEQPYACQFCGEPIRYGEGYVTMLIDYVGTGMVNRPVHMTCMSGFVEDDLGHHVDELQAMLVDLS